MPFGRVLSGGACEPSSSYLALDLRPSPRAPALFAAAPRKLLLHLQQVFVLHGNRIVSGGQIAARGDGDKLKLELQRREPSRQSILTPTSAG